MTQTLLSFSRVDTETRNALGWTTLHEACNVNQADVCVLPSLPHSSIVLMWEKRGANVPESNHTQLSVRLTNHCDDTHTRILTHPYSIIFYSLTTLCLCVSLSVSVCLCVSLSLTHTEPLFSGGALPRGLRMCRRQRKKPGW